MHQEPLICCAQAWSWCQHLGCPPVILDQWIRLASLSQNPGCSTWRSLVWWIWRAPSLLADVLGEDVGTVILSSCFASQLHAWLLLSSGTCLFLGSNSQHMLWLWISGTTPGSWLISDLCVTLAGRLVHGQVPAQQIPSIWVYPGYILVCGWVCMCVRLYGDVK